LHGECVNDSAAPLLVKQTARARALAEFLDGLFELEILVTRTARLRERLEERRRALEIVERDVRQPAARDGDEHLRHPIGVRGTPRDVDDRQAGLAAKILARKPRAALEVLQSDRVGRIGRRRGHAAP